jgi:glycosyltransferase involved in cell wall biosynthesis
MTTASSDPLVSVVTPVYNGEQFLRECIESVRAQSYQNWEFCIVNNCSTDRTLEIAQAYAAKDSRVRVHSNSQFLSIIENHNNALRQISSESKYCKVIFADDWLFPQCIEEMVRVAEAHPSIGIVGAYGLDGTRVLWDGLPYPSTFIPGRELCRKTLLSSLYVFGSPTSLLFRSDFVRIREAFFDEDNLHADHAACFELLQSSDFGFVHQVLTFTRTSQESNNTLAQRMDSIVLGNLGILLEYGPACLTREEFEECRKQLLKIYYRVLARGFLRFRGKEYWNYHRHRLNTFGCPLSPVRLAKAVVQKIFTSTVHPIDSAKGAMDWWPRAMSKTFPKQRTSQKGSSLEERGRPTEIQRDTARNEVITKD